MKELEKVLNIMPAEVVTTSTAVVIPNDSPEPENIDFEYARANYYELIEQGKTALAGALNVAQQSENPRAYEVVGALLKNLADVNRQVLQIGEDREKVKSARKGNSGAAPAPASTNNTAIFVGTGMDLNKLIQDRLNK